MSETLEPFDFQTLEEAENYFWEKEARHSEDYEGLNRFKDNHTIAEIND